MNLSPFIFNGKETFDVSSFDTGYTGKLKKEEAVQKLSENQEKIEAYQSALYAENRESVLVILQGIDASGKDGIVKHVFSGINPSGISVCSFKQPSAEELSHDYLWRTHMKLPARGEIGIFNRSYYEEVLVARVNNLPATQCLPKRTGGKNIWEDRYEQINRYEEYLYANGWTILKFFLDISKKEQKDRFLKRLDTPAKNWKVSSSDYATRAQWSAYMKAYEECINKTGTKTAPWFVLPADNKWFARYIVSEILVDALAKMNPQYPTADSEKLVDLEKYRKLLDSEK